LKQLGAGHNLTLHFLKFKILDRGHDGQNGTLRFLVGISYS